MLLQTLCLHAFCVLRRCILNLASYPAFPRVRFLSIFHTVNDKNLTRGTAGYEAILNLHTLYYRQLRDVTVNRELKAGLDLE